MNPAKFFLNNYKFTVILTIGIVVFGVSGMKRLNSESYPSVAFAMATVTTNYDGASADEVENRITKPIEDEIRGVANIKDVKSVSQAGKSVIFIRADIDNVDVEKFMGDLQRSVDRVSKLPSDLRDKPKFVELKSEEFPVIQMAIVGPNENRSRDIIADRFKESVEDNKSVLAVQLAAYNERQFRIKLDPELMAKHHIGVNEVIGKIQSRNINIPGGRLKGAEGQTLLRMEGKVGSIKDLEEVVLRSNFSGQKILVKDVGEVIDDQVESRQKALLNGKEATLVTVTKKAGADTINLVDSIDSTIEEFKAKYPQYQFEIYLNEGLKVKDRLDILTSNAVSGLVLVMIFLFIFLPGRIGFMASFSLPLAVLVTFGFMPLFGMNINAITVLALVIALGMLVDNSVVISENYARLLKEGMTPREAALDSISKLWLPISVTAFTTAAAFLPMLVTKGIMGQFIKFIPIVVTIALAASLVESFFFLPMRLVRRKKEGEDASSSEKKNPKNYKDDWFSKHFVTSFERLMSVAVRHRYLTSLVFAGLIGGAFYMMFVVNKFVLFPAEQTENYFVRVEAPRGSSLETTEGILAKISKTINDAKGGSIDSIVAQGGVSQTNLADPQGKTGDDVGLINIAVNLETRNTVPATDFLADLRKLPVPEGVKVVYESLVNGPPVGQAISATIRSNSLESLTNASQEILKNLGKVPGISDLSVDDIYEEDKIYIDVDEEKAARLGLSAQAIGQIVRSGISGSVVSDINLNNKKVEIHVQMKEGARRTVENLSNMKVMDARGNLVPIGRVATFRAQGGTPQIKRFDFKRSKTITGSVDDTIITSVKANKLLAEEFNRFAEADPGLSIVFGGEEESTKESMSSLFDALILSLIGIFALLVFLFKSYLRPAIIMSTIPLGMIGASIAFYLHDRPISFLALIGVIGLGGIIVNSGIILISFIDEMRNRPGQTMTLDEILVKASGLRLRAVVVSSLTTISGLLPTAYGIGGSDALLIPMTLAMAWGLTSGTLLTLVWVPPAYGIIEDLANLVSKIRRPRFSKTSIVEPGPENEKSFSLAVKEIDSGAASSKSVPLPKIEGDHK